MILGFLCNGDAKGVSRVFNIRFGRIYEPPSPISVVMRAPARRRTFIAGVEVIEEHSARRMRPIALVRSRPWRARKPSRAYGRIRTTILK